MAGKRRKQDRPREISMTDLEAAEEREGRKRRQDEDIHAAGTPGGGTAVGGLAGTNVGGGSPDNADLEDALGTGIADNTEGTEEDTQAYSGLSGGAVGGTPAGGRTRGGRTKGGLTPGNSRRGDSTIGGEP